MNALVNDQLGRLRNCSARSFGEKGVHGRRRRPAKFGRYTGRTLYPGRSERSAGQERLETLGYYLKHRGGARERQRTRDQELVETLRREGALAGQARQLRRLRRPAQLVRQSRAASGRRERQSARARMSDRRPGTIEPRTRSRRPARTSSSPTIRCSSTCCAAARARNLLGDARVFRSAPGREFLLILDEAHLYRGANGTEVAYLVRRLLDRLGLPPSRVAFIATSASFSNADQAKAFVSSLCGVEPESIVPLTGSKHAVRCAGPGDADLAGRLARCRSRRCSRPSSPNDRRCCRRWPAGVPI